MNKTKRIVSRQQDSPCNLLLEKLMMQPCRWLIMHGRTSIFDLWKRYMTFLCIEWRNEKVICSIMHSLDLLLLSNLDVGIQQHKAILQPQEEIHLLRHSSICFIFFINYVSSFKRKTYSCHALRNALHIYYLGLVIVFVIHCLYFLSRELATVTYTYKL